MNHRSCFFALACFGLSMICAGCGRMPQREPEATRPEQVVNFAFLYAQNCAGCHGANGKGGPAIPLNNPIYLTVAGAANIRRITSNGVAGTMMPPFGKPAGGMLTSRQIDILAQGMESTWGHLEMATASAPQYQSSADGNAARGHDSFGLFCARCHRAESLLEPAYLALISDQGLRTTIIAGEPERGMPAWSSDGARPMTDQEVTDIVAWLASHRTDAPGAPYEK